MSRFKTKTVGGSLIRNGKTVRTILQILKELLKGEPNCCEACGSLDFEEIVLGNDEKYLKKILLQKKRGPPTKKAGTECII